jgi:hypothetical protein
MPAGTSGRLLRFTQDPPPPPRARTHFRPTWLCELPSRWWCVVHRRVTSQLDDLFILGLAVQVVEDDVPTVPREPAQVTATASPVQHSLTELGGDRHTHNHILKHLQLLFVAFRNADQEPPPLPTAHPQTQQILSLLGKGMRQHVCTHNVASSITSSCCLLH